MGELFDFFGGEQLGLPIVIFLMVFSCGIAIFHTVIFGIFNINIRPKWLFYALNPALIGGASLLSPNLALVVFIVLFASVFILGIIAAIVAAIRGNDDEREFMKQYPKAKMPLWKKILGYIAIFTIGPLFLASGPYAFVIIIAGGFIIAMLPSSKNRFKKYQATLPTSKIRSLAMGLVEVQGRLIAKTIMTAPIDNIQCIGYKYLVERISTDKDGRDSYSQIICETRCNEFIIEDETGSIPVNPDKLEFIWVEMDGRYSNGTKRYTQYLLKENDEVLIIGKASVRENNEAVIEHENVKNVFAVAPKSAVNTYNQTRPLVNSFALFSCILAFFTAVVLVLPVAIVGDRVVVKLDAAMFNWEEFFSKLNRS